MRLSISLLALVAPLLTFAVPIRRTESSGSSKFSNTDILVFQFAGVLENLETSFYTQALNKFQASDFTAAGFTSDQIPTQLFSGIKNDESTHLSVIETTLKAIGGSPVSGCSFDFSSVLVDVSTMLPVARIVENVGVAAYLGGATLVSDTILLDAAASIMTVEARHQTILNMFSLGSAIPQSFDIALSPSEVLAIAGSFISGCDLGIPANPSLTITNNSPPGPGSLLTFSSPALNGSTDSLFCQMMVGGLPASIALPLSQCIVPDGINGPVAVFITSDGQPLVNNVVDRATTQLVAGPAMAFIDTQPQMLSMLARSGSPPPNSGGNSTASGTESASQSLSTQTISPDQAQSIISSVAATATTTADASTLSGTPAPNSGLSGSGSSVAATATVSADASTLSGTPAPNSGLSGSAGAIANGWTTVPASSISA
jgi:hypothetical protein